MKPKVFAAVLALFVLSLPLQAVSQLPSAKALETTPVKIDLNKADALTLSKSVKGIGQKRAAAIISYREKQGRFNSVEELAKVKGFGKQFMKNHLAELQKTFIVR